MTMRFQRIAAAAILAAGIAIGASPAHAYTFTFDDEYMLRSGTAFSTVFPGASGSASGNAFYQETTTGASPVITRLTTGITGGPGGEFQQGTNASAALALFGWTQSLNYGQVVGSLFNTGTITTPYFQYHTGITPSGPESFPTSGTTTAFTFNSVDLRGVAETLTLEGFLNGNLVYSATINVTNTLQTFTENWTNVDTIEIAGVPMSSNALTIDNVTINTPVPEPMSLALLGTSLLGFGIGRKRRNRT